MDWTLRSHLGARQKTCKNMSKTLGSGWSLAGAALRALFSAPRALFCAPRAGDFRVSPEGIRVLLEGQPGRERGIFGFLQEAFGFYLTGQPGWETAISGFLGRRSVLF